MPMREKTRTEADLVGDLGRLGVRPGMLLCVHSSLRAIGWVEDGAPTVVRALIECLGPEGTLVMPAATPQCADPSGQELFDRASTPTRMGKIAETFRGWEGTLRSDHPLESVCARGPLADEIIADHPLEFSEGPGTPFGRLHDRDGRVLLMGVGFNRCTALHYAETIAPKRRTQTLRFPMLRDGERVQVEIENVADDNDTHFPNIGAQFMLDDLVSIGPIGETDSALFSMRELVSFAQGYFEDHL